MTKKNNPLDKSLEAMDDLMEALKEFSKTRLKDDLVSMKVDFKENKDLYEQLDEVSENVVKMRNMIHNLSIKVSGINVEVLKNRSSRFASGMNVVHNFLSGQ